MSLRKPHSLTSKAFWDRKAAPLENAYKLRKAYNPMMGDIMNVAVRYLPRGEGKTFFEIGCYPGRLLILFKETLGYSVSGIDYADKVMSLREELAKLGVTVIPGDFFDYVPDKKYDVVASF